MDTKTKKQIGKPTQEFLQTDEIRDDVIIMRDGTLRAVLAVSSTNFDLKNTDEQNALIYGYQRFLNSLDHHIQILVQSRKINISDYVDKLKGLMDKQTNELLRMQTSEYIEFINRLVESANVMNKNFYVILPYEMSVQPSQGGFFSKLFGKNKVTQLTNREKNFLEYRKLLEERVGSVQSGLSSIGLRVVRLDTNQLIELVYNSYNFASGPLIDAGQLSNITITQE